MGAALNDVFLYLMLMRLHPAAKPICTLPMLFLSFLLCLLFQARFLNCRNVILFYIPEPNLGKLKNNGETDSGRS